MKKHWPLILYGAVLLAVVLWVSFYGGPLPYTVFYTVLLLPAAAGLYLFYVCQVIRFYQELPSHHVSKGECLPMQIIIENTGPLPIVSLRLFLERTVSQVNGLEDSPLFSLRPGEKRIFSPEIICLYAGTYFVGVTRFQIRDCFGLFSYSAPVPTNFRVIVRPQITDRAEHLLNIETVRSAMEIHNPYLTENTLGNDFREYVRGDSLRHIHWKNSAKAQQLLVRKPEPRQMQTIRILLLPETISSDLEAIRRRDQFLELAVSIADYFCQQNKSLVFFYPKTVMRTKIIDSYQNFLAFYKNIADDLTGASKSSLDWKVWLQVHEAENDGLLLLLNEEFVDKDPITVYEV